MSDRRRHPLAAGTTVMLTPSARRVGALLRARDLDRCSLLAGVLGAERDGYGADAGGDHGEAEAG